MLAERRRPGARLVVTGSGSQVAGAAQLEVELGQGEPVGRARDGVEALHAELARHDAVSAERLKPRDRTRIARALEVVDWLVAQERSNQRA